MSTIFVPMSLLPIPGNMLEEIIHWRIYEHLENINALTNAQWGFCPTHCTVKGTSKLIEKIQNKLNSKEQVGIWYTDLQKAFDLIDHKILLEKLAHYGMTHTIHEWLRSYLSNRQQRVLVNWLKSSLNTRTHGVPQGSCIVPLLFLIYINDITS